MQPYATGSVSLGSAEEPYDSDMTHSYRLTEGQLIRYPLTRPNRSRLAPPDRVMGNLRFMGIPNWLAFAVIGLVFILMMKNAYS